MKKEVKIILYCVLAMLIIVVFCLMIWWPKHDAWEPDVSPSVTPELIWQEIDENSQPSESWENQVSLSSEQDILNDLETLFNSNNWYENMEWDFWFISSDN
jgi:hypothetical protein